MKKLLIALLFTPLAHAGMTIDHCINWADEAEATMQLRQAGYTYKSMYKSIVEAAEGEATKNVYKGMLEKAFKIEVYSSDYMKNRAIDEFQNFYFSVCLTVLEEQNK